MMRPQLVVIGASLGGTRALAVVLDGLPEDFTVPLAIVQHRAADAVGALCSFLQGYSRLPVSEIEDKQPISPAQIYLAPADYHVLIETGGFALSTEAPILNARPSIDALFESAADAYAAQAIGVILTGASGDGARGLARIKQRGGLALVQSPETAECRVMPEAAIDATQVDWILPLAEIAPCLVSLCHQESGVKNQRLRPLTPDSY
ncbi:MAG TPA: chemotaxis protein CheB [Roseiflexaceae bacterium]|nr:chemotaxis protein CheB [Roseiflexaceae bacterium]